MTRNLFWRTAIAASTAGGVCASVTAHSAPETVLYSFQDGSDGAYPAAGLIDVGGNLYSITTYGGTHLNGTLFKVTTAGVEAPVYAFGAAGDGANPSAGLVSVAGEFYGATQGGGNGQGMVFKITKRVVETALHSFGYGSGDGVFPSSSLVKVGDALFGTTTRGGAYVTGCEDYGCGTVFQITPAGVETVVHSFSAAGSDGVSPGGGLLNVGGTLYGTAQGGGANSYGTVFSVTPEGAFAVLYSFKGGSDGEYPDAGLIAAAGVLYGTTSSGGAYGGGTVFALTSTGPKPCCTHLDRPMMGHTPMPRY